MTLLCAVLAGLLIVVAIVALATIVALAVVLFSASYDKDEDWS